MDFILYFLELSENQSHKEGFWTSLSTLKSCYVIGKLASTLSVIKQQVIWLHTVQPLLAHQTLNHRIIIRRASYLVFAFISNMNLSKVWVHLVSLFDGQFLDQEQST